MPNQANVPAENAASGNIADRATPVVVIFSWGSPLAEIRLAYIAEHLASHGYAAVAIEHAETSAEKFMRFLWGKEGAPGGPELLLRPQDITAVLDHLSAQQTAGDRARRKLNLEAVGILGQSLGWVYRTRSRGARKLIGAFLS